MGTEASGNGWTQADEEKVGNLLAYAFPDRIARREPDGTYRLVTGRVAGSLGAGRGGRRRTTSRAESPWIVAPDADAGETAGLIRLAAPVDADQAQRVLAATAEEKLEIRWEGLVPKGFLVRRAGRLSLAEKQVRPSEHDIAASFLAMLSRQGVGVLPWNTESLGLLARMRFFARMRPDAQLGDLSDAGLAARASEWLGPAVELDRWPGADGGKISLGAPGGPGRQGRAVSRRGA